MVLTDWICFLVLDIGTPEIASLPIGTRVAVGALQAAAVSHCFSCTYYFLILAQVRAAGFGAIPLNALAPAVKCVLPQYVLPNELTFDQSTIRYNDVSHDVFEIPCLTMDQVYCRISNSSVREEYKCV